MTIPITRRRLLKTASAVCGDSLLRSRAFGFAPGPTLPPFSKFVDVAQAAGLTQSIPYGDPAQATYIIEVMGGGCAFFDYDNDGWMDVLIVGGIGGDRHEATVAAGGGTRLYHNNRDGTFKDITTAAGLSSTGWATGVCVGDYNNDGFEDLFLTAYGQNRLLHNNGNGTFTDVTARAGLLNAQPRFATGCTFVDYDRDGWLDLFVTNYADVSFATLPRPNLQMPNCSFEGVPVNCGPSGLPFPTHSLFRNNRDGTFSDVSRQSGIAAMRSSYGLTAVAFDVDEDGWPDIFVACDSTPSLLLMNNRDGTFREEGLTRGVALSGEGHEMAGMGIGVGDIDLDGHLDLVKTHFLHQASGLYRNSGKGEFEDVTVEAGLGGEQRFITWGAGIVDLDNDGLPDVFEVTGTVYPELESRYPTRYPSRSPRLLFRNLGDNPGGRRFLQMGAEAGPGVSAAHQSRGCAFGDFDNDGDLDILIMNQNEPPSLLRNDAPAENNWLKVRLEGTKSNRSAIGTRIVARYGTRQQAQTLLSQTSYLSANDPRLHFGLGAEKSASLQIHWPSGATETIAHVEANRLVLIREGAGVVKSEHW
ncbi:CRTAC1 family protein [Acidipila sp. EB88]|uniref:CRTAC1 family protein n=1 Tax=Acidipila sp. EB88 TaxID=2305226 RepID=UPI0013156300|nr:CRTAC1 family protein [Acidipila sp. EB88]